MSFIFIVPMFDEDIFMEREMRLFKCKTPNPEAIEKKLDEHPSTMGVLIPCLLTERGFYSYQPYMPNVNHRDIDHHVMQYNHDNGRAVLHAFAQPSSTEDFNNRPFILSPYQVKEVELAQKVNVYERLQLVPLRTASSFSMQRILNLNMCRAILSKDFAIFLVISGLMRRAWT